MAGAAIVRSIIFLSVCAAASAQSQVPLALDFSGTGTGGGVGGDSFSLSMTGNGATGSLGAAKLSVSGTGTNAAIGLTFVFTLASGDMFTAVAPAATPGDGVITGSAKLTGGTGSAAPSSGSFSFTLTSTLSNPYTFALKGSGTIVVASLPPVTAAPTSLCYDGGGGGGFGGVRAAATSAPLSNAVTLNFTGQGSGGPGGQGVVYTATGSGTLAPFGAATFTINGTGPLPADGETSFAVVFQFVFTFASGGKLTIADSAATASDGRFDGTATVKSGTGQFAGATGSFTYAIVGPGTGAFTMQGSGTIVTVSTPVPPASSGGCLISVCYDGSGGAGGGVLRTPVGFTSAASTASSSCSRVCYDGGGGGGAGAITFLRGALGKSSSSPASAGSCAAYDGGGGGGSGALVFDGTEAGGANILAYDGGSGGAVLLLTYDTGGGGGAGLTYDGGGGGGASVAYDGGGAGGAGLVLTYDGGGGGASGGRLPSTATTAGASATYRVALAMPLQTAAATYSAGVQCTDGASSACWVAIPVASGSIAANTRVSISAIVSPQGLDAGVYTAIVSVTIAPAGTVINIPLRLVVSSAGPRLSLSQTGLRFVAASEAAAPAAQTITIAGPTTPVAVATSGETWLSVSQPATGVVTVRANPAGLAVGNYSARLDFSNPDVTNGTQSAVVSLTVLPAAAVAGPVSSATALVFTATAGSNPALQTLQLTNPGTQTLTITTQPAFLNGANWLTTFASGDKINGGQTLAENVSVNAAGLATGVYLASLTFHAAESNRDLVVEVMLFVKPAGSCTPAHLYPVISNLEGGFSRQAGVPVPLEVLVYNGCGVPLTAGAVTVYSPHSGDAAVELINLGQGRWTGTWMPRTLAGGAVQVGVIATSYAPVLYGSMGLTGTLTANAGAPVVRGVGGTPSLVRSPVPPGGLITIAGSNLAAAAAAAASDGSPLPFSLNTTQVWLNGEALPLVAASANRIDAVAPYDSPVASTQQLLVRQNGAYSLPQAVVIAAAEPGVFTQDNSGTGAGVINILQADGSQTLNSPATPAGAGDQLAIYGAGLGAVTPQIMAGTPVSWQAASTVNGVSVTIGGQPAMVNFAGLSPVGIGWYEVDVTVPAGVPAGPAVGVVVTVAGVSSAVVSAAIR